MALLPSQQTLLPAGPTTDVLGGITPAGLASAVGVNTLANPNQDNSAGPVSGNASMGDMLKAKGVDPNSLMPSAPSGSPVPTAQNPPPTSAFAQTMAKNADQVVKSNPQAAAAPGGWARSILGGAMTALSGIEAGLGDAAAASEKVPPGGGALTGITRTLAARTQRLAAQKQQQFQNQQEVDKNKALNMEANARMVQEQTLTHKLQGEAVDEALRSGREQLAVMRSQPNPAAEKMRGLTSDQAKEQLRKDNLDPSEETMVPSDVISGTDKDGNPYRQLIYSIVKFGPVDLDPKNPAQKAALDRLNQYAPPDKGKTWQGDNNGVVHLDGPKFNMLYQQASDAALADLAKDKATVAAGVALEDVEKDKEALSFSQAARQDPNLIKVLHQATNPTTGQPDFISARNLLYQETSNPQSPLYGKYNNIDNDMREWLGFTRDSKGDKSYVFDKMLDDYQKKQDTAMDTYVGLLKDADKAHGSEAASLAKTFQDKANDPNTPPALKPVYQKKVKQLNDQAQADIDYAAQLKRKETDAENAANTGDMSGIMDMVKNYDYDPDKLFSRFKDLKAKRDFMSQIYNETGQKWSDSEYKARYNTKQDYRPDGKGGQAVQGLNTFAEHTGDANSLIQSLNNTKSPFLNKPLNEIDKKILGQPQFVQYRVAVQAAADNYISFLLSNHAKHASDDDLVKELTSDSESPAAAQAIMRQMAQTIAFKAREQNAAYRKQMGQDIPQFLDPDTEQVFRAFGIDPKSITTTGVSGLQQTGAPSGQQTQGQGTWGSQFGAKPRGQ